MTCPDGIASFILLIPYLISRPFKQQIRMAVHQKEGYTVENLGFSILTVAVIAETIASILKHIDE